MKTSLKQFIQVDKGLQRVHVRQKLFRQIRHIPLLIVRLIIG